MLLRKGTALLAAALIFMLTLPAPPVHSAEQMVRIVASNSGSYDLESRVFTAEGGVEVHVGDDVVFYGDYLHADLAGAVATLHGSVRLVRDDQEIRGELLTYDLETGEGTFQEIRADLLVPDGTVYVAGHTVLFDAQKYNFSDASFTTCDLEESHYRLVTREVELYPGDRAIVRHVIYYEGKLPLFYWPYLVVPLREDLKDLLVSLPVIGYSEQEGYFIKTAFNYYRNANSYGNIYVDLYTRLGVGLGIKHNYRLEELGEGHLYLWGIPTSSEKAYKAAWEHSLSKKSWTLTTKNSVEKTWIREQTTSDTTLSFSTDDFTGKVWLNYKNTPEQSTKKQTDLGLQATKKLTDRLTINVKGNYVQKLTSEEVRILDYLGSAVYTKGKNKFTLTFEQQFNPDLLGSGAKDWRSVQRVPELKWEISDLGLSSLPLQAQLMVGRYGEKPSDIVKNRAYGQLTLRSKTWRPRAGTTITYQGDLNGALYSDEHSQAWLYGRVSLSQSLGQRLSLSGTYRRRDVWGSTPFKFDAQKPLQDLNVRLNYNQGKVQASATTTYDFLTKKFSGLTLNTGLKASDQWRLDVYASYDLNAKKLTRVVPLIEYKRDQFSLKFGLRYRPDIDELERVDMRFTLPLASSLSVTYDSIYNPGSRKFTKGVLAVNQELHCRTLTFSYDHVSGRVAVQLTINAFPTLPIGWDSQGGLSLFDFEDVADIIDVEE